MRNRCTERVPKPPEDIDAAAFRAEMERASKDPMFIADEEEVMRDFAAMDNEMLARVDEYADAYAQSWEASRQTTRFTVTLPAALGAAIREAVASGQAPTQRALFERALRRFLQGLTGTPEEGGLADKGAE